MITPPNGETNCNHIFVEGTCTDRALEKDVKGQQGSAGGKYKWHHFRLADTENHTLKPKIALLSST